MSSDSTNLTRGSSFTYSEKIIAVTLWHNCVHKYQKSCWPEVHPQSAKHMGKFM